MGRDPLMPLHRKRYAIEPLFVIAILFAMAAPLYWLHGEVDNTTIGPAYENAQLYQWTYPQFHYMRQRFQEGSAPLWNPQQLCGTALLADPRIALFQPINAVRLFAPAEKALALHAFACLFMMGSFFCLFARALGLGYLPASLGGLAYAFSGASAAAMSRPGMAAALAWAPAVMWGLYEFSRRRTNARATLAGLLIALLLLSGGMALALVFVATAMAWLAFLYKWPAEHIPGAPVQPRWRPLVLLCATAIAVPAIQWLPSLGWIVWARYNNGLFWEFEAVGRFPGGMGDLFRQLLLTQRAPLPAVAYVGVVALLAVPVAVLHRQQRGVTAFFAGLAIMGGGVGIFSNGPWPFHFPPQALLFAAAFGMAVLVAIGFDVLLKSAATGDAARKSSSALFILPALIVFYIVPGGTRGYVLAALLILVPALIIRSRRVHVACGMLAALLLFSELFYAAGNSYRHPYEDAPGVYQVYAETFHFAEEQALGGRLLLDAHALNFALPANAGLMLPVKLAGGAYMPLSEPQAAWWRRAWGRPLPPLGTLEPNPPWPPSPRLIGMMAAPIVVQGPGATPLSDAFEEAGAPFRLLREENGVRCFENSQALPRAYWVPAWRSAAEALAAVAVVVQSDFDPERECVITGDAGQLDAVRAMNVPEGPLPPAYPLSQKEVKCQLVEDLPERVVIQVTAPAQGVLVLADSYAPGWRVQVDGEKAPLLQANGIFRGVALPAGDHKIVFAYKPLLYPLGLCISLGALALIVLLGFSQLIALRLPRPKY